jgi:excisionase family DNA binding protein
VGNLTNLYTVDQAADYFKVKPSTVRAWLVRGALGDLKLARTKEWRIREEDIQDFTTNGPKVAAVRK